MEKYARQAVSEGVKNADDLHVGGDSELYRVLNLHYNRNNHIEVWGPQVRDNPDIDLFFITFFCLLFFLICMTMSFFFSGFVDVLGQFTEQKNFAALHNYYFFFNALFCLFSFFFIKISTLFFKPLTLRTKCDFFTFFGFKKSFIARTNIKN